MTTDLDSYKIAIRLALALIAGGILGFNRIERDRPAGLRTTILVCLTACVGMLEANLLLGTRGRVADAFVSMDVMRIPLGILSGMGFIGAGTILRRDNLVLGVTTAATLWFATMIGMCFGGGQQGLGLASTAIGAAILWCLRAAEQRIRRYRHATLNFALDGDATEESIRSVVSTAGFKILSQAVQYVFSPPRRRLAWEVEWISTAADTNPPEFLREIAARPEVVELDWKETRSSTS